MYSITYDNTSTVSYCDNYFNNRLKKGTERTYSIKLLINDRVCENKHNYK